MGKLMAFGQDAATAKAVTRVAESRPVAQFLAHISSQPCVLVVEGEAGIGKTTFLASVVEQARSRGIRVLSARPTESEAVLAYASLADLMADVDPDAWSQLPAPQRRAIDAILLRTDDNLPTDQRTIAAAFVAVIEGLARRQPVLLAIDDLPWLDPSSAAVLAFASRRFTGCVGLACTVRLQPGADGVAWIQPRRPDVLHPIRLPPMRLDELHTAIMHRLGRSISRPTLLRVHEVSGGNPFYAIELARAIGDGALRSTDPLPNTLAEVVHTRLAGLSAGARDVLLAASCSAEPSAKLLAGALDGDADTVVAVLEEAENKGIVTFEGSQLRFCHPLLAHGVYAAATPARRREIHRRMARTVDDLESRARHLALAAVEGDPATLDALDAAANLARVRGAPIAAAELLELAIRLGGDTAERRIELARCHFDAGDPARAAELLEDTLEQLPHGEIRADVANTLAIVLLLTNNFLDAANLLEKTLGEAAGSVALTVQMLITLAFAQFNLGKVDAAITRTEQAIIEAERLGQPDLLGQALSMRTFVGFLRGDGYDTATMDRALSLEDRSAMVSTIFQPSAHQALLLACTGELEKAADAFAAIKQRCIDQGEDGELTFVSFHSAWVALWRSKFDEAAAIADEMALLAQQLNGDLPLAVANTIRGVLAAYTGREAESRQAIQDALAAAERAGATKLAELPVSALGFLEVSLGHYDAALDALAPLLATLRAFPRATEIMTALAVPDLIESFIQLGRLDEAEPLIDALERNGERLDRSWMLAIGGRGRAMLSAARGDLPAALDAAQQAMTEHDRLPMPFERARTLLLLGQIQRRQRGKGAAATTLRETLASFEELGCPLWAARARDELDRVKVGRQLGDGLSAVERRVAELAITGMTNREVAAALFISPKTVESNLARVYRKLGIRTRAELGSHVELRRR